MYQPCLTEAGGGGEQQSIKAASGGPDRSFSLLVYFRTAEQGLAPELNRRATPAEPGCCLQLCSSAGTLSATRCHHRAAPALLQLCFKWLPAENHVQVMQEKRTAVFGESCCNLQLLCNMFKYTVAVKTAESYLKGLVWPFWEIHLFAFLLRVRWENWHYRHADAINMKLPPAAKQLPSNQRRL